MVKLLHKKSTKKGIAKHYVAISPTGRFRFPRKEAVLGVVSEAKSGKRTRLIKLKKSYSSAGYKIMGLTDDGIVIVRPSGKSANFRSRELQSSFSGSKSASKSRRPSF